MLETVKPGVAERQLLKGLSRVSGNRQARFLWGWGSAMNPGYQTNKNGRGKNLKSFLKLAKVSIIDLCFFSL